MSTNLAITQSSVEMYVLLRRGPDVAAPPADSAAPPADASPSDVAATTDADPRTPSPPAGARRCGDGAITATYSNGKTQTAGQIALVNFRNVQGLSPIGSNNRFN